MKCQPLLGHTFFRDDALSYVAEICRLFARQRVINSARTSIPITSRTREMASGCFKDLSSRRYRTETSAGFKCTLERGFHRPEAWSGYRWRNLCDVDNVLSDSTPYCTRANGLRGRLARGRLPFAGLYLVLHLLHGSREIEHEGEGSLTLL
jgi:hypothetical protein